MESRVMTHLARGVALGRGGAGRHVRQASAQQKTLDAVKQRGQLGCGVQRRPARLQRPPTTRACGPASTSTTAGRSPPPCSAMPARSGTCRPRTKERFTALQSGELDVLARNTTWTLQRDSAQGLSFVGVNYYDGQGFMVKKSANVKTAKELGGATVCVQTRHHHRAQPRRLLPHQQSAVQAGGVREGRRGAQGLSGRPLRRLHHRRFRPLLRCACRWPSPTITSVLPDIISKEPLGPSVRQGDSQWFTIVRWVHFALLNAEEAGVTQANVDQMLTLRQSRHQAPARQGRRLRQGPGARQRLGLQDHQAGRQLRRDASSATSAPARASRSTAGLNKLWTKGGLQYAPPIR